MIKVNYSADDLKVLKSKTFLKNMGIPNISSQVSPFRYPGGKSKLSFFLALFIKENQLSQKTLLEPFCGGAGGTLALLDAGVIGSLILNDSNSFISEFWEAALSNTDTLVKKINTTKVNMDNWFHYREIFMNGKDASDIEKALAVFFLNRTNRSGILHAGPIGGRLQAGNYLMDCRFNKENLISRINRISKLRERITVANMDASDIINSHRNENVFVYADPPYVVEGKNIYNSYSYYIEGHLHFAKTIKACGLDWLISYDDAPLVHELYSKSGINIIELSYVMNRAKVGKELLIASSRLNMPKPNQQQEVASQTIDLVSEK